jgi:hypothetical protein
MTDSGSGCVGWMIDDSVLVLGSRDGTRSLGAKGVESGVKGRQIRRPFHSDCDLLRSLNVKGNGRLNQLPVSRRPPTADRLPLLFRGIRRASTSISSPHPPALAHLANAPHLAAHRRHLPRRFVSFFGRSDCAPRTSVPSFPGRSTCFTSPWTNLDDWLTPRCRTGLGTDDDAMMTSTIACLYGEMPRTTSLPSSPSPPTLRVHMRGLEPFCRGLEPRRRQ